MTQLLLKTRYRFAVLFFLFSLGISLVTRLVLLTSHRGWTEPWAATALAVGEVYDLLAALWLTLPLFLFLTFLPERWFRARVLRAALWFYSAAAVFALLFVSVIEGFFFAEFDGRFNFVAVDYLMFPTEVVTNIWESYPTGWIVTGLAVLSAGAVFLVRNQIRRAWDEPARPLRRAQLTSLYAGLLAVATWAISPSLAQVSNDRALNEIASNGYYTFWMALLGSDAPYEGMYATRPMAAVTERLHRLLQEPAAVPASFVPGTTRRQIRALGPARRMNVVIVLEESLGSEFIGVLHPRPKSLTPQFDALSREGTLLTHAYSTGNRTIRAIEATTASIPPLPGVSIVRRSSSEGLFTLPNLLRSQGYQTLWVYGGRALFDGMGGYLRNNGVDRIVEQKHYPKGTFMTAWGAADEAIFDQAIVEMDRMHATGRPFYTLILSVSNHRPFDFPETELKGDPNLKGRENAVRYADHSLGRFIRQAKSHPFFANTLFVLMGDHGARVYGAAEIPLPSYEVPILFYAPGVIPAGARVSTLASSMDVPPTVLGLLGLSYESKFFGRDLFRLDPSAGRALMTHNNVIALMQGSRLAVLGLRGTTALYDVTPQSELIPVDPPDPAGHALIEDAIAYYHGADHAYRSGAYAFTGSPAERLAHRPPG